MAYSKDRFDGTLASWPSKEMLYSYIENYIDMNGYKVPEDYEIFSARNGDEKNHANVIDSLNKMMIQAYIELETGKEEPKRIFENFCYPVLLNFREYGAADTEPRSVVMAFLEVFILNELQKRKTERLINSIKNL